MNQYDFTITIYWLAAFIDIRIRKRMADKIEDSGFQPFLKRGTLHYALRKIFIAAHISDLKYKFE